MNKSAGRLEIEAGITVLHNECERIFSSVPIHFGKGVSLEHGASIYCTGVGDDIYIGDYNIIDGELVGVVAYVQRIQGKKAIIGDEIRNICGATIEIEMVKLEFFNK